MLLFWQTCNFFTTYIHIDIKKFINDCIYLYLFVYNAGII